jgi:hypothetical protein
MPRLPLLLTFALGLCAPASALAHEPATDPQTEQDRIVEETIEVEVEVPETATWMGLRVGSVLTPYRAGSPTAPSKRVTSNQARACLDPLDARYCGSLRGFDLRVEMFEARGRKAYPRWLVFFRTGYAAGRFAFEPGDAAEGFGPGDPRALAYQAVPLFFGGNLYLFEKFPIRPYGGLGFGFDVLRLQYRRHEAADRIDASARIGFELHAGLEARITNYVSLNAEVMQLWSARRKMGDLPHYSNEGLTFIGGVSFAIPTEHSRRRTVRKVRRIEHVERATPQPAPQTTLLPPAHPMRVEVIQKQEVHTTQTSSAEAPPAVADTSEEAELPIAEPPPLPPGPTPDPTP